MPASKPTFRILKTNPKNRARLGVLKTPHGTVRTPAYVIVATSAAIRTLAPADIKTTGTQIVISNTFHLWDAGDVHKKLGTRLPMMTDSGGFQVFSFGAAKEKGVGKVLRQPVKRDGAVSQVRITEKGVHFSVDGRKRFLSPELSMKIQERLGANIIFAFDECTSPLHPYTYTKNAMERTHRWALRCLKAHTRKDQLLYGIVQGGRSAALRRKSAQTIGALPFGGFGIGGSFGKDEMVATLDHIIPHLPDAKPRHLLGIGSVSDIFAAVEAGVDTMDCVIPTREARHGRLYTDTGIVDIRKMKYADDRRTLKGSRTTFATLHRLFRARDMRAGRLATLHNVSWFNGLMKRIRAALSDSSYRTFSKKFLVTFARSR